MLSEPQTLDDIYFNIVSEEQLFGSDLHTSLSNIAEKCADALAVKQVSIWILAKDNSTLERIIFFDAGNFLPSHFCSLDGHLQPEHIKALLNSRIIASNNTAIDTRLNEIYAAYLAPHQIQSLIYASIRQEGHLKGVLCIETTETQRTWTQEEIAFAASIADLISQFIIVNKLARSKTIYQTVFDASSEGIMVFRKGFFHDVNPAICDMFGGPREQIIGRTPIELSPRFQPDGQASDKKAMNYIAQCLKGNAMNFEWRHTRLDGREFDADITLNAVNFEGEDTLFAFIRDITDRKTMEHKAKLATQELQYRASHDQLTSLANRSQLHTHLNTLIDRYPHTSSSSKIALVLLDLNRFKEVNDTLGHATGDKLLTKVAKNLLRVSKKTGGELYRFGGDEFVAVFSEDTCKVDFQELPDAFRQCLKTPIEIDDINIEVGASIGIATYPDNGLDSHELLRCADVAMYGEKNNEAESSFYNHEHDIYNKRRLSMISELGSSIRKGDLILHFQPRINLKTCDLSGCEALVRWHHPKFGFVPPSEFLPLAEMTELIHPLTQWVLNETVQTLKHLQSLGYDLPIAINVSARNLTDNKLTKSIENLLTQENIPSHRLEIEITESALINNPKRALENLEALNSLGLRIAIDDFGTGYSSLSYLKKMPVSTLKIDRSFVAEMLSNECDTVIVDSTINLAHNFSHIAVAEGIEDKETLELLTQKHCDQGQGFYIAKPMPYSELTQWLNRFDTKTKPTLLAK